MKKLAIITTHPIQYNAPLFSRLAERNKITIKVFYTWGQAAGKIFDPGFGKDREWDIPLLEGYDFTFTRNTAANPGSHHFWGVKNPELISEIESWKPDAVLIFGWSFYSHLRSMVYFKKKLPVLFRGDSTLLDENNRLRACLRRIVLTLVYKNIDIAFYTGENNRQYFKKYGVKDEQLVKAPHAVDGTRFENRDEELSREARQWRASLGFCDDDWVVLFVGKLEEKKNPQFILRLAEKITDKNIKFLFVGNGPLETTLKKRAAGKPVIFLDFQNQSRMPVVYRLGNVLVLPSKGPGETWGLAANEAMASGLPVILSSKVGGASDLVLHEKNGLVFEPDDWEKVVRYIQRLAGDEKLYREIKEKAKKHIRNFTIEAVAAAIEKAVIGQKENVFCVTSV